MQQMTGKNCIMVPTKHTLGPKQGPDIQTINQKVFLETGERIQEIRKRREQYMSDNFVFNDDTCNQWIAHGHFFQSRHFAKVQSFGCHVGLPSTWYLVTLGMAIRPPGTLFLVVPPTSCEPSI